MLRFLGRNLLLRNFLALRAFRSALDVRLIAEIRRNALPSTLKSTRADAPPDSVISIHSAGQPHEQDQADQHTRNDVSLDIFGALRPFGRDVNGLADTPQYDHQDSGDPAQ